jgi:hypothetical protein
METVFVTLSPWLQCIDCNASTAYNVHVSLVYAKAHFGKVSAHEYKKLSSDFRPAWHPCQTPLSKLAICMDHAL